MHKILLIGGKAGAGKDTIAKFLVENYGFTRFAFADILKTYVAKKYNLDVSKFHTHQGKNSLFVYKGKQITHRALLIKEATDKRKLNIDYWADLVIEQIKRHENKNILISDFRFSNEYNALSRHFETVIPIQVTRDDIKTIDDPTECALDNFLFHYTIKNDSNKAYMYKQLIDTGLISLYFNK